MKVFVNASEPISTNRLRAALGGASDDAEIMVVAPALHRSVLRFWLSDANEAIRHAELVQRETVEGLDDAGLDARGDSDEIDPVKRWQTFSSPSRRSGSCSSSAPSRSSATTRASTWPHCSNGLACRSSEPNEKPEPLSARKPPAPESSSRTWRCPTSLSRSAGSRARAGPPRLRRTGQRQRS
jgi:hypothetical protein